MGLCGRGLGLCVKDLYGKGQCGRDPGSETRAWRRKCPVLPGKDEMLRRRAAKGVQRGGRDAARSYRGYG